jgi:glucose-6-phosphate 1-dehydrogenase
MSGQACTAADVLVIFGITGDLAEKMTFRALYRLERRQMLHCPIVGVARDQWSAATLRDHARRAIAGTGEMLDEQVFQQFAERLSVVSGDLGDQATYDRVARAIEGRRSPVFYLEIPPSLFGRVVEGLAGAGLVKRARVVVEKPFGHDLASARALNAERRKLLRIDHFLGKPWTSCSCGSPTPSSSRCGTATTSTACRSPWPRTSACRTGGVSMTRSGRCVTSCRTICCSSSD